jgi:tetratricopeptide (TPR) repeat protein
MGKGYFHCLGWPVGLLLLIEGLSQPIVTRAMQDGQSKTGSTVSAGIPKAELDREAELKRVMDEGREAYRERKYDQALSRFQEALELTKHLDSKNGGNVLLFTTSDALAQIGYCNIQLHQLEKAETNFTTLLEFRKQNLRYDSSVGGAFENLAVVEAMQNNLSGAEDRLKQAIAYMDECINHFKRSDAYDPQDIVANDDRKFKARLQMELANVYANRGKFDEAFSAYEEAFQIGDKFKAEPTSQIQIVNSAMSVAELAKRADKLKVWQDRNEALQAKKD